MIMKFEMEEFISLLNSCKAIPEGFEVENVTRRTTGMGFNLHLKEKK